MDVLEFEKRLTQEQELGGRLAFDARRGVFHIEDIGLILMGVP